MTRKFLVVRFSSIGDIVLTTPVIRCLKEQVPGAEVHYLTKKSYGSIIKSNPHVSGVYEINEDTSEVIDLLKGEGYEMVIDLHHNLRTIKLKAQLNRHAASFRKLNLEKWLLVNFKLDRLSRIHIVDRYMETVEELGVKYDGKGLDFFIPQGEEVPPDQFPDSHKNGFIAAVIGAKHATKRLPVEEWNKLIDMIQLPVVVLGGPEDQPAAEVLKQKHPSLIWNACGTFNLNQSASLVKQAKCVITHDTGLMHIAAAFRKRIISIWGNTVPEFGMYPFLPEGEGESVIFERTLSCRPCSKIGFEKCPKSHFKCMKEQDLEQISALAKTWWGKQ